MSASFEVRHLDFEHQQRDRDGEHAVAEGFKTRGLVLGGWISCGATGSGIGVVTIINGTGTTGGSSEYLKAPAFRPAHSHSRFCISWFLAIPTTEPRELSSGPTRNTQHGG